MMNVLGDGCSERGTAWVGKRHDPKTICWYVLTFSTTDVARRDRTGPAKSSGAKLSRRKCCGEILFKYLASSHVEVRRVDGKMVNTEQSLLFNYVSVRSSAGETFQMKRMSFLYNFLPRAFPRGMTHFPYLSDDEVGNLRRVVESYSNESPAYVPDSDCLLKGDHVRITSGYFTNMEVEVVIQPGGGHKDVMARTFDCMWVPSLKVKPGEHKLIGLSTKGKHVYTHLDNGRLWEGLHDASGHYHVSGNVSEEDTRSVREVLRFYGLFRAEMDMIRCKIYSLLFSAYKSLGDEGELIRLYDTMRSMLPAVKAPRSRVLSLVMLYGCTGSTSYRQMVREVADPWRGESSPKKNKLSLIRRLDGYDGRLNHEIS